MKVGAWIAATAILAALGFHLIRIQANNAALSEILQDVKTEVGALKSEREQLKADLDFYSFPENLSKELRAKFDFKKPGETLIKIQ